LKTVYVSKKAKKTLDNLSADLEDIIAEEDDLKAIAEAEKEFATGETVNLDDFEKTFKLR